MAMKEILKFLILLTPLGALCQLQLEWIKNMDIPGTGLEAINGLVLDDRQNLCFVANQGGTKVFGFNGSSQPTEIYSVASYWWWIEPRGKNILAREGNCLTEVEFSTGAFIGKTCYQIPPDWATTSPVGRVYRNSFYYTEYYHLCKFKMNGEVEFMKQIAQSGNSQIMRLGGDRIYIFGTYSPGGARLMQFDTLGNQNWSLAPGPVFNILADDAGHCYVFCNKPQSDGYVIKYDNTGKVLWSADIPGQALANGYVYGDSLFLCGIESIEAAAGQQQNPAF
jgi:hypothetical protein